jgi:hypothetical protein
MRSSILVFLLLALAAAPAAAGKLFVTTLADAGAGSLRQALQDYAPGDTIAFAPGLTGTITNLGPVWQFARPVTVLGPGASVLAMSGADARPIFLVSNGDVRISGLTIRNGRDLYGAGIYSVDTLRVSRCTFRANRGTNGASAIAAQGVLEIDECTFESNLSDVAIGSAVGTAAATTVRRSTFNGNQGGGLFATASLVLETSTFTNNSSGGSGAGVQLYGSPQVVRSCTIVANHATGPGGGVYTDMTPQVSNTIIAGNTGGSLEHDWKGTATSLGFNLVGNGDGSSGFGMPGSHDQVGTAATPLAPQLAPLADYGGPTWTMPPLPGSLAIDQGTAGGVTLDQRGRARPYDQPTVANMAGGDGSDIGAYELRPSIRTVTTLADAGAGSLRQAIADLHPYDADSIKFAANVRGRITLTGGVLTFTQPGIVVGPGAWQLAIHGNDAGRVFIISAGKTVEISGLTVTGARENEAIAILALGNTSLRNCRIVGNNIIATDFPIGGVIRAYPPAAVLLENCTVANNSTGFGGGVLGGSGPNSGGTLTVLDCTFSGNTGPGIVSSGSVTNVLNSTVTSNNTLGYAGSGIWQVNPPAVSVGSTIIAGNFGPTDVNGAFTTSGYNLVGRSDGSTGLVNGVSHDRVGTAAAPLSPNLAPLAANGGPGETHALVLGSPAMDKGHAFRPLDQRGAARYDHPTMTNEDDGSDIGAYEYNPASPVGVPGGLPARPLALAPARPNPANGGGTVFASRLDRSGPMALEIFDVAGRRVRVLVSGDRPAGAYADAWDGRDDRGRRVPAGLYFARLLAGGAAVTRSVVVLP